MKLSRFISILRESVPGISKQEAIDRKLFGPVYHGTTEGAREEIAQNGFRIAYGEWDRSNGYRVSNYAMGLPAPIHHLGFGVYFTTVRAIAKKFNGQTTKGLREYYLDVPRLEVINFASPDTMMKWWIANGYDFRWDGEPDFRRPGVEAERTRATHELTDSLKSRFDAVWFKGKTMYKALDGDQICVYDPARIFVVDQAMSKPMDVGSRVKFNGTTYLEYGHLQARLGEPDANGGRHLINQRGGAFHWIPAPGTRGVIMDKRPIEDQQRSYLPTRAQNAAYRYTVKWARGGTHSNYLDGELDPA